MIRTSHKMDTENIPRYFLPTDTHKHTFKYTQTNENYYNFKRTAKMI